MASVLEYECSVYYSVFVCEADLDVLMLSVRPSVTTLKTMGNGDLATLLNDDLDDPNNPDDPDGRDDQDDQDDWMTVSFADA